MFDIFFLIYGGMIIISIIVLPIHLTTTNEYIHGKGKYDITNTPYFPLSEALIATAAVIIALFVFVLILSFVLLAHDLPVQCYRYQYSHISEEHAYDVYKWNNYGKSISIFTSSIGLLFTLLGGCLTGSYIWRHYTNWHYFSYGISIFMLILL